MTTCCGTLIPTLTLTPTLTSANADAIRCWARSGLTALAALTARVFAILATSMIIDAVLYGIASRSTSAGLARFLAVWSASAQPMGHALALVVFGVLAAAAGATPGLITASDFAGYPGYQVLLFATTASCAWAATALRRLQASSWA